MMTIKLSHGKHVASKFAAMLKAIKFTQAQAAFSDKPYCLQENLGQREIVLGDLHGFLAEFPDGAILDERQRALKLFSYLPGWARIAT